MLTSATEGNGVGQHGGDSWCALLSSLCTGIQSLVLSGRISEAIRTTQTLYPGVLESKPELLFQLKCRQFVEMIAGTDTDGSMTDAGSGMGSPVGVSGARSHASVSPSHSSRPSSCLGSQPGSPLMVSDQLSPSSPIRGAPPVESAGNGHVANGVNGADVSLDQEDMEREEEDEEEEMELTDQRQHHSPPALGQSTHSAHSIICHCQNVWVVDCWVVLGLGVNALSQNGVASGAGIE